MLLGSLFALVGVVFWSFCANVWEKSSKFSCVNVRIGELVPGSWLNSISLSSVVSVLITEWKHSDRSVWSSGLFACYLLVLDCIMLFGLRIWSSLPLWSIGVKFTNKLHKSLIFNARSVSIIMIILNSYLLRMSIMKFLAIESYFGNFKIKTVKKWH